MDNPSPAPFQSIPPVGAPQPAMTRCAVHANVAASFRCDDCGRMLCNNCGFSEERELIICTECLARRKRPPAVVVPDLPPSPIDPELAQKMADKSDLELLDMFESPEDWRPESLAAAREELQKRNIPERLPTSGAEPQDPACHPIDVRSNRRRLVAARCSWCGRENTGEATHCQECGTELGEVQPAEPSKVIGTGNAGIPGMPTLPSSGNGPPVRLGIMCVQHPKVQAIQQCRKCGAFMCATCDFTFPGNVHFCPICVSKVDEKLSGKPKKFMLWSFVLAAWSTVGMTCLVSGAMRGIARTKEDQTVLGWVLIIFVLGPAITGLSLGMTAKRKQGPNPPALWIAIIWNAVLVTSYVVLTLIGLSRQ